jgi:hypothetical protein
MGLGVSWADACATGASLKNTGSRRRAHRRRTLASISAHPPAFDRTRPRSTSGRSSHKRMTSSSTGSVSTSPTAPTAIARSRSLGSTAGPYCKYLFGFRRRSWRSPHSPLCSGGYGSALLPEEGYAPRAAMTSGPRRGGARSAVPRLKADLTPPRSASVVQLFRRHRLRSHPFRSAGDWCGGAVGTRDRVLVQSGYSRGARGYAARGHATDAIRCPGTAMREPPLAEQGASLAGAVPRHEAGRSLRPRRSGRSERKPGRTRRAAVSPLSTVRGTSEIR